MPFEKQDLRVRVLAKFEQGDEQACWPWKGAMSRNGYGQTSVDGKAQRAHRVVYGLLRGPIPEGMQI